MSGKCEACRLAPTAGFASFVARRTRTSSADDDALFIPSIWSTRANLPDAATRPARGLPRKPAAARALAVHSRIASAVRSLTARYLQWERPQIGRRDTDDDGFMVVVWMVLMFVGEHRPLVALSRNAHRAAGGSTPLA